MDACRLEDAFYVKLSFNFKKKLDLYLIKIKTSTLLENERWKFKPYNLVIDFIEDSVNLI